MVGPISRRHGFTFVETPPAINDEFVERLDNPRCIDRAAIISTAASHSRMGIARAAVPLVREA
jgi:hypothetical protein